MSDNQMPIRAVNENQIVSTNGDDLPESVSQPKISMPRQISILNMINQWQPMGFRVILNLPFISDDQNFIFAIRNGPFIPTRPVHGHYDISDPGPSGVFSTPVYSYSYNNMVPVVLPSDNGSAYPDPAKPTITLTNYDLPPPIATFAQAFRRWRGDMQYRLRMVAGFATQGYVIGTSIKNVFSPIGVYDQFKNRPAIERQDISFRPAMMNAYALSDTSMYRHLELTMPYDYPTTYYDQLAWISRRCTPGYLFRRFPTGNNITQSRVLLQTEPHGDNWIVIGIRGDLNSTQAGSQIIFELEYRCAEGFQFADPFLPPSLTTLPLSSIPQNQRVYRVPDDKYTSDGIGMYTATTVGGTQTTSSTTTTTTTRRPLIGIGVQSQAQTRDPRGININISGQNANLGIQGNEQKYDNQHPNPQPIIDIPAGKTQRRRKGRDIPQDIDPEEIIETEQIKPEQVDISSLSALERLKLASGIPGGFSIGKTSRNE